MNRNGIIFFSIAILVIGLFGWQNVIELRSEEPRRAIVSLEMLISGEYIVPKINGWAYYNKPPLFNWIMAGFFALVGTDEWVVRLPSLLSLAVIAISIFMISRRYVPKEEAMVSSLLFITSGEVLFYGSVITGEIDFFFSLIIVLQSLSLFLFYKKKQWTSFYVFSYVLMALGFLTKGLPSLAFQAFTLIAIGLTFKRWTFLFKWQHLIGGAIGLAIISGYLLLYNQQDDAIGFLIRQTKEAGMRSSLESSFVNILREFFLFPLRFMKLLLPWSLILLLINKSARSNIMHNPFLRFCFWFIVANILVYWFAGSFGHRYVYMFMPFTCVLLTTIFFSHQGQLKKLFEKCFKWAIMLSPALFGILVYLRPEILDLNNFLFNISVLLILLAGCIYSLIRFKKNLLSAILFMAVLRIGFNFFYLPILQDTGRAMYYRDACNEILKITGDEQIFLYGKPYVFNSKTEIGPFEIDKTLTTAPLIPYKIPYYLTRSNKKILLFDPVLKPNRYYLIPESMSSGYEILYKIADDWQKKNFFLIRT